MVWLCVDLIHNKAAFVPRRCGGSNAGPPWSVARYGLFESPGFWIDTSPHVARVWLYLGLRRVYRRVGICMERVVLRSLVHRTWHQRSSVFSRVWKVWILFVNGWMGYTWDIRIQLSALISKRTRDSRLRQVGQVATELSFIPANIDFLLWCRICSIWRRRRVIRFYCITWTCTFVVLVGIAFLFETLASDEAWVLAWRLSPCVGMALFVLCVEGAK